MANNLETELGITNRQMGTMSTKITNLVNSLTSLQTSLQRTASQLRQFVGVMNGINTSGLQNLFDGLKNLSKLYKIFDKMNNIDLSKITQVFGTLNKEVIPFITTLKDASKELEHLATIFNKFNSVNTALKSTSNSIRKVKDNTDKASVSAEKLGKKLNIAFNWGNLYLYYNLTKKYTDAIVEAGFKAMDFTETLNLFQSTFKELTNEAYRFNTALQTAFGTNIEETMRYQSQFNAMIYSLSKLSDTAYLASENLVKMGKHKLAPYISDNISKCGEHKQKWCDYAVA